MKNMKLSKPIILTAGVLILLGVVAVAAIDNQISACVNNKTGAIRIINFLPGTISKQCAASTETALTWNKEGIPGPKGDKGEQGPAGTSSGGLHLYDGNGQDLGGVISFLPDELTPGPGNDVYTTNVRLDNSKEILLSFYTAEAGYADSRLLPQGNWTIYYTQSECNGDVFITGEFRNQLAYQSNTGINFTGVLGSKASRTVASFVTSTGCQSSGGNVGGHFDNTYLITPITLPFSEPLAWPLEIR